MMLLFIIIGKLMHKQQSKNFADKFKYFEIIAEF